MRRKHQFLLTAVSALSLLCIGTTSLSYAAEPILGAKKVVIHRQSKKSDKNTRFVPGAPAPIDAWVMGETLSMTFLTDLGEAEVTVSSDMSAWSVTETFYTADGTLLLTVDTDPGDYTITVTTSDASYIGGYSVE